MQRGACDASLGLIMQRADGRARRQPGYGDGTPRPKARCALNGARRLQTPRGGRDRTNGSGANASSPRADRTDNASRASQPIAVAISSHPDAYMYIFAFIFVFVYLLFAQGALGAFSPGLPGIFCTF